MFNTNVNVGGSHFNYNVNAVSGTLRKSHPKSKIVLKTLSKQPNEFDPYEPSTWIYEKRKNEPIVVLQVMLCGNDQVLIEIVPAADFEAEVG